MIVAVLLPVLAGVIHVVLPAVLGVTRVVLPIALTGSYVGLSVFFAGRPARLTLSDVSRVCLDIGLIDVCLDIAAIDGSTVIGAIAIKRAPASRPATGGAAPATPHTREHNTPPP